MKSPLLIFILFFLSILAYGQTTPDFLNGNVSYISSQNVYVKFDNTTGINVGDTLYVIQNDSKIPAVVVNNLSSISCVGKAIGSIPLTVSTKIIAKKREEIKPVENLKTENNSTLPNDQAIHDAFNKQRKNDSKEKLDGRFTINSYSDISRSYPSNQRFRYNLSLNESHIGNSNLSAESYISFTHRLGDSIKLNNALKIYSLALKYDFSKTASISFGRKVNLNMANIGAVDGLQYEQKIKNFTFGALVGSRPDYTDYSLNTSLLQYGAFLSHNYQNKTGNIQTSVAFFNQMNNFKTDRRFAYIQHSNSLLNNVDLFCSFEVDLYSLVNNQPTNTLNLTSTYISLRLKPSKNFSMSLSYDARKNIYYYETFKNKIDSILDKETRQGFRIQTNYRPLRNLIWGLNAGYRFQPSDPAATINGYSYLTYTQVPWIDASATINATALKTSYMSGTIYGISLSKDIFNGNLYTELQYRIGNYQFTNSLIPLPQNIAELSLTWRIAKKTMLSADFEATLEKNDTSGRFYLSLSQRF